jgi:hypothetical protein
MLPPFSWLKSKPSKKPTSHRQHVESPSTLKMAVTCSSKTTVDFQWTIEDWTLHNCQRENFKSYFSDYDFSL